MTANSYAMSRFTGRAALISGGASGIGRATAIRLAAEGAHVFIADLNKEMADQAVAEIRAAGGSAAHVDVDLADDTSVERCARAVAEEVPTLHFLVNNAAILRQGRIEDGGWIENWEIETRIGLRGWVMMTQLLLPLLKQEGGAIVNLSSEGGYLGRPGMWVYDAIKAGVVSTTKTMAQEFIQYGIRVNAVAPGWIVTEMHFASDPDPAARKRELEDTPISSCLMQRRAGPEEVASAIAFLLSDDASYITGTTLHVDGGRVGMNLGHLGVLA
ncbi:MAG: SDR family oxidoreductase [Caldilineaceae bacterium SB0661_bin_32]|uniref:SDR family oxidoreductase n=1 Tax=Caldilineaceae bacterium SB0661_bin_32 TaxID=2605255 RepID=A0A6B1D9F5_9CHLR|nr:SDR family oxidoreductase [Caldilineaceae bacterium SB0661_bin_32]